MKTGGSQRGNAEAMEAIGFGSLNLDEFWEAPQELLDAQGLKIGHEYVRDVEWFNNFYPVLKARGFLKGVDPGGSAANMIAALKRMGFSTGFIGAAGREDAKQLRLDELGSPTHLRILLTDLPSGRCLALLSREDPQRDRALVILPNANNLAGSEGIDAEFVSQFQWLHMTSFVSELPLMNQISLLRHLEGRVQVSFDPGPLYCRLGVEVLKPILQSTKILFVTEDELALLSGMNDVGRSVRQLVNLGIRIVVVKKGSAGIHVFSEERSILKAPPTPVRIVDRTGAGDVAAAGFVAGALAGADLETCVDLALAAASQSVQGYGRSAYPDKTLLRQILEKGRDSSQNCSAS